MEHRVIKKINQYFHDEEALFFAHRHKNRIKDESRLYRHFFCEFPQKTGKSIKVLDIGTGKGLVAHSFPVNIGDFVCTDLSYNMLFSTKKDFESRKLNSFSYVVCDAESLPFKTCSFDVITCNAALHHFPDINKAAEGLRRILRAGGALLIGFEPNRRFWNNRMLSLVYRLIARMKKSPRDTAVSYDVVCKRVNEKLIKDGIIGFPLSSEEILRSVDIHSPNAGEKIDYSKGFDVAELTAQAFEGFEAKAIYHYNGMPRLFNIYNRLFFPKSAPQFSLMLKKRKA